MTIKHAKITKQSRITRLYGYSDTYNVKILNFFNPELQLKETESSIKSKLIDLLSELRGFKFLTTLILKYKVENRKW